MSELENKAKQLTDEELETVTGGYYRVLPKSEASFQPIMLADESDEEKWESKARPLRRPFD